METLSRNIVPSLILAALRGFCLLISEKHAVGISAKKPARIRYPALCCFGVSKIYELSELTMGLNEEELKRYNREQTPCLRCYFPESPHKEIFPVLGATPGVIGTLQATETLKFL